MEPGDLTGAVLDDRYQVLERIAQGAMGVVYRAERLKLGKTVAVKVLHDELPDELSSRERFEREAMAMAKLEHPHCASVLDVGIHEGRPFVVMDFVTGEDLTALIAQGPQPVARAIEIVRQVLSGLAHAHELGIIHRDIKPANVLLGQKVGLGDHVKILDFGLARLQAEQTSKLTTGIVVGTPAYMAPEQIRGLHIDARADLYACGVLLMELVTGKKPFHSAKDDPIEVVSMHLKQPPPRLAELLPGVDFGALEAVVAKALAKSPDDRYQRATDFVAALEAVLQRPVSGLAATEPAGATMTDSQALQISESMMIPQGGTQLGLVVPVAARASAPGPGAAVAEPFTHKPVSAPHAAPVPGPSGHPAPAPHATPAPDPGLAVAAPAVTASPSAVTTVGPRAFVRPDTPVPSVDPSTLVSPIAPAAPEPDPLAQVQPLEVAPLPVGYRGPDGLPFTKRQLMYAGGGLLGVVVLIALIAGGSGPVARDAKAPDPSGSAEIEMDPATTRGPDQVLARANALVSNGEREEALKLLASARGTYPDSAEIPYFAGKLYFAKMWWTQGVDQFRHAVRIAPGYKADPELIKTVLRGFITTPSYNDELADFLIDDIGEAARSYLEETMRDHPNAGVRARAKRALQRLP